jgi:hypothetical protein
MLSEKGGKRGRKIALKMNKIDFSRPREPRSTLSGAFPMQSVELKTRDMRGNGLSENVAAR